MTQSLAITVDTRSRDLVATLALMYLRHAQPERALPLSVAAMSMGAPTPELALTVASAFLACDNPQQAEAVLSRFWSDEPLLDGVPSELQISAAHSLSAKISHRLGDVAAAREALRKAADLALDLDGTLPPEAN